MGLKEAGLRGSLRNVSVGASTIPDSGIARWTFDDSDTESGTALDVWNNNDGTINGATTGVTGANQTYNTNEAYEFDATDDYIDLPLWGSQTAVSVALWARAVDTVSTYQTHTFDAEPPGHFIRINAGGTANDVRFFVDADTSSDITVSVSDVTVWNHYVLTTAENGTTFAYVNGSQVGSAAVGNYTVLLGDSNVIATSRNITTRSFGGRIDDPRLYSKQLSDTEVSNLYNTGSISG